MANFLHRLARMFPPKAGLVSTVENRIVDRVVPATHTTDPVGLQKLFADMLDAGARTASWKRARTPWTSIAWPGPS